MTRIFFHVCVKRNNLPYRSILIFFLNYLFFVFAFWVKRYYNERITNIRRRGYARRRGLSYDVGSDFEEYSRKKDSCDKSFPCNFCMGIVSLYLKSCAPAQDFLFTYVLIPFSPLGGFLYETNCYLRKRRYWKIYNCL